MAYSIDTTKYIGKMKAFCKAQGVNIDLDNPKTIQDKLAWLNIYDEDRLKTRCADKIKLHEYCKEVLGEDICVPIIKIYNSANDVNFDELPNKFVLKCNHGSGMNVIVSNKKRFDEKNAKRQLSYWMNDNFAFRNGFEAHYNDIERKVFAEEYMEVGGKSPYDYKVLCFNGEPKFIQVFGDRFNQTRHMNYYDTDFEYVDLARRDFVNRPDIKHKKPDNLNLMLEYSKKLSKPFKFVRVDFYEVDGKLILGEMTFTPGAMAFRYRKDEDNVKIGDLLNYD